MKRTKKLRNKTAAAVSAVCALLMLGSCAAEDIFNNLPGENATELYASSIDEGALSSAETASETADTSASPDSSAQPDSQAADPAQSSLPDSSAAESKAPDEKVLAVSAPANPYAAEYFLDGEPDGIKNAYRSLFEGVFNYQSTITLPQEAVASDALEDLIYLVLKTGSVLDEPGSRYEAFVDNNNYVTKVTLSYSHNLTEGAAMYEKLMKRVDEIVKEAEPLLTDYDKVKYFHDTIINGCVYDDSAPDKFTAYGALCDGKAVCSGYAMAFQLLCEKAGIPAIPVYGKSHDSATGKEEDHIWNKVRVNGEWFVTDVTGDDPVGDEQYLRYDYFLIDDLTAARSLTPAQNRFMTVPSAVNAFGDYYSRNGLVINYDNDLYWQLNNMLTSQMTDGWKEISMDFRCLDQNLFERVKQEYFTAQADGTKGFGNMLLDYLTDGEQVNYIYSMNENTYTFHVKVTKM